MKRHDTVRGEFMDLPGKVRLRYFACPIALLLCELISRAWGELGIIDDWSYVYSAQRLVQSGHVHYVGWAAAIVGWQLYLSAAAIKLLGSSYTAARLPTLLIGLATVALMQRTLVRLGVREENAILGTLTFVLSPLFLPLTATMMTDVPAFFSILACLYACVRALQSASDRKRILWICLAVAINAICGTSRQNAWVGVLVLAPSALWMLRSRRRVLLWGTAATILGYGFVLFTLHWFNTQPYALPEPMSLSFLNTWALKRVGVRFATSLIEISWLLTPVSLPFLAAVRRYSARSFAGVVALMCAGAASLYFLGGRAALAGLLYPFNGDLVGPHAMFENATMASQPPVVLHPGVVLSLGVVGIVCLLCVGATVLVARPPALEAHDSAAFSWPQLATLLGPVTLAYSLLLSPRAVYFIFDRYLLFLIFVAMTCLLLYSQQRLRVRWTGPAFTTLAAIAFLGVVLTHNLFAFTRARAALVDEVLRAGIPRGQADLGFDVNGLSEIAVSGHVNEPHIVRPAGAYRRIGPPPRKTCIEAGFGFLPHLSARYGIAFDPDACEGVAPFAPVQYSTWPLGRATTLYLVKYPPPWGPESDYEVPMATAPSH